MNKEQNLNTEQERAEFEAWCDENEYDRTKRLDGTGYNNEKTKRAWAAWQAGRAALAAQAHEAAPRDSLHDCALGDSNYAAGMLLGWNLCVDGRDEDFHRIREDRLRAAASASKEAQESAPAAQGEPSDPLQGAANWLLEAIGGCNISTLQSHLKIGVNRAERLMLAARAAQQKGASK